MTKFRQFVLAVAALAVPPARQADAPAPQVRLEITARVPAYNGRIFGARGAYETITGVAHMRIDPHARANRGIVDLERAPRARDGLVEYAIDFAILRPIDPSKARRIMIYEVVNRGMRLMPMMMGGGTNPADAGDGLLQNAGFTLVASGWQGDIAAKSLIGARFPVATNGLIPATGTVSTEAIFDSPTGTTIALPYPAETLDQQETARLTVRQLASDPPINLPSGSWRFVDDRKIEIQRPTGVDAGAIYSFTYAAKDPKVMGLGFAATRDFIAWLRRAPVAEGNPLADIGAPAKHYDTAVAFGGSQSGRYLRDFLWQGFNRDLAGRRVFDGVIPFIPGARQTFTNFRFAEPGRFSRQHEDHGVPGFTFPFTYATLTDPVTGKRDGVLKSCSSTRTCPRLFHIDTSAEFWQAGSSLVGTGGTGRDVPLPANVRAYMIAGGAHAPGMVLPACRYPANALNYSPVVRALLMAMIDWAAAGTEPPANRWPSLAKGELVPVDALRGPSVPAAGLVWAKVQNRPEAPAGKPAWPVFVPAIDPDGNDMAGIRLPDVAAPKGTWLGWNLRKTGFGEGDLCLLAGSYLPFAADAAARAGDLRLSLAERYASPDARAAQVRAVTEALRRERLLLDIDAERLIAGAAR